MGWLYCEHSKQSLVERLTKPWEDDDCSVRTIKHCIRKERGEFILWSVNEYTLKKACDFYGNRQVGDKATEIHCIIISQHPDYSSGWNSWGFNAMTESAGPYYYRCPVSYLKLANAGINSEWRKEVKTYHRRLRNKQRFIMQLIQN
ncbi:hypothetical protein MTZ49_10620 [Entomomonas sp. E2T0]|uniref:hypothetical protein n=1 Tax=Entomomonas sp. E2T0 TaxID=2930213 RepID=UPI0022283BE4|nr:hypothetical protein [Entomomonas sp. E2T0]UYZ83055.1 hypothetical protein MTZ49_10620 [Entomomonas sp. E2T0]